MIYFDFVTLQTNLMDLCVFDPLMLSPPPSLHCDNEFTL